MHSISTTDQDWRRAALRGVPIALFMLALYAYWFGFANRYSVFLYEHLNATPFDEVTRSRYWMAGLVASGLVLILYNGLIWLVSRFRMVTLPAWWRVWIAAAALAWRCTAARTRKPAVKQTAAT